MNPTVSSTKSNTDGTWSNTLSNGQTITSANPQSIYAISSPKVNPASQYPIAPQVSTTTVSNENKQNQVVGMQNKVNQMSQGRGQTSDGTSVKYADGTLASDNYQDPELPQNTSPIYGTVNGQPNRVVGYNTPNTRDGNLVPTYFDSNSSTPAEGPEEKQFNDLLSQMKASTDATTARAISSIQQKFGMLKQQQKQINEGQAAATKNTLLMGGVTGQGSSAQYAPLSSEGIVTAQLNYGVQKLAELDTQEQDLINEAQSAGDAKNFQLLEKKLSQVERIREEKVAQAKALNDKIVEQNAKAREKLIQSSRDSALADLYTQGVTDPSEILTSLNQNGGDFTLKEIKDGLSTLVPPGLDDLVKTMRQNGAPVEVIAKVTSSPDINTAYRNAGNYGAGGTGIIGEYNFYKAQAEAKGQTPLSFSAYQDADANRKKSIAKAGVAGGGGTGGTKTYANDLEAFTDNVVNLIPTKFGQETFRNSMAKARTDADKIRTAATVVLKNSPAPVKEAFANQAVGMKEIDKAIALIDEGVKTGAIQAGKQYTYNIAGKDFDPKLAAIQAHITGAIQPYRNTVTGAAWGNQEDSEYASLFGSIKYEPKELKERLKRVKDIMLEKSVQGLSSQVDPFGTGTDFFETKGDLNTKLVQTEDQAKATIDKSYTTFSPEVKTAVKSLFGKGKTNADVVEYLTLKGIIK